MRLYEFTNNKEVAHVMGDNRISKLNSMPGALVEEVTLEIPFFNFILFSAKL